jgi:hypothetical protein
MLTSHPSTLAPEFMNTAAAITQSAKASFVFQTFPIKGFIVRMDRMQRRSH